MRDKEMLAKQNRRRYYLKQRLKNNFKIDTRQKQVEISSVEQSLSNQQKIWLSELGNKFGYNLQYKIS
jgi:hypothetical protein